MKQLMLFFTLFIINYNVTSQSKVETEDWIIKQISENNIVDSDDSKREYYFEDGVLFDNWLFYKSYHVRSIQIKNIKNIKLSYSEVKKAIFITLTCTKSNCCKYDYISSGDKKNNNTTYEDAFTITLNAENSNLIERLNKAFKHLVTIYGGKATSTIKITKEPF